MLECSAIATLDLKVITFRRVVVFVGYPVPAGHFALFLPAASAALRLQSPAAGCGSNQQMESL